MSNFLAAVKATHKPPMPHQQAAWNFAWDQLDEEQKAEFLVMFRSDPPAKLSLSVQLDVPYEYQLDNASGHGYRECFSSSCAMVARFWKRVASDNAYNVIRSRYGDTTDAMAQVKALQSMNLDAKFVTNASVTLVENELRNGRPIAVGWLHHGSSLNPTGGGHWSVLTGFDNQFWTVNDPNGEANLISGGYKSSAGGRGQRYSRLNFNRRWLVDGPNSGWAILCKPFPPHDD
jgi:hypothetical protein